MDAKIPFNDVLTIAIVGLVIVVCMLIMLIVLLSQVSKITKANFQSKVTLPSIPGAPFVEEGINDEVVAVIAAAIAAMSEDSNGTNYSIRGIKKANVGRPAWAMAGLNENTRSF